ncbi:hypothetical protein BaRGS_00022528 [Batillaria attramentaria]|uniref:Uncharacterized protein n=1 Tax=Batillaria attramentaria TaxID=370345 RepID=A0ABD0KGY0_9CAEN
MPVQTTWTLYGDLKTWSEAELLCEMSGGHLAVINTTHRVQVFEQLIAKQPWKSAIGYGASVSLHNVENEGTDPRYWAGDCSQSTVQFTFTASSSGDTGGCASKSATTMYSIACDYDNEFVCETGGGACTYVTHTGKKATSNVTSSRIMTSSDADCQGQCDVMGIDCWAAARESSTGECWIYTGTSPFHFDGGTNMDSDADFTMFIKTCYEGSKERPVGSARAHCASIGQTLAGASTPGDLNTIRAIVTEFHEATYAVSSWYPLWVDITGVQSEEATWGDGTVVSGTVSVQGADSSQCGLLDISTGQYSLDDCSQPHSFLCVKHNVTCVYVKKTSVYGTDYTEVSGVTTLAECRARCDSERSTGSTCFAFSFKAKTFFGSASCYLHPNPPPASAFFPPTSSSYFFTLYRWTCPYAVLQMSDLMEEHTTEAVPQTSTLTEAKADVTSESTSSQQTTYPTFTTESEQTTAATTAAATTTEKPEQTTRISTSSTALPETTKDNLVTSQETTSPPGSITEDVASSGPSTAEDLTSSAATTLTIPQMTTKSSDVIAQYTTELVAAHPRLCVCGCRVQTAPRNSSLDIIRITEELKIEKNATFKSRMRYMSIYDDRPSAQGIGVVAIGFVSAVLGLVFFLDISCKIV